MAELNPSATAKNFREEIRDTIRKDNLSLKLVGLLAGEDEASEVYSEYTKLGCEDVGVSYEARRIPRLKLEAEIRDLNEDTSATGVIVYYPIFGGARDAHLRSVLSPLKDIEGLHPYWLDKLYSNERTVALGDGGQPLKALLPCTPLAIFKLLEAAGEMDLASKKPFAGKKVTIFNRSEVVGRPLAYMMANDGALVYSFDLDGSVVFSPEQGETETVISRQDALSESDIVITGVPSRDFDLVKSSEVKKDSCCLNFSSIKNFDDDVSTSVRKFIPRVGPVTVAMCLRNVLRLHQQFHNASSSASNG